MTAMVVDKEGWLPYGTLLALLDLDKICLV